MSAPINQTTSNTESNTELVRGGALGMADILALKNKVSEGNFGVLTSTLSPTDILVKEAKYLGLSDTEIAYLKSSGVNSIQDLEDFIRRVKTEKAEELKIAEAKEASETKTNKELANTFYDATTGAVTSEYTKNRLFGGAVHYQFVHLDDNGVLDKIGEKVERTTKNASYGEEVIADENGKATSKKHGERKEVGGLFRKHWDIKEEAVDKNHDGIIDKSEKVFVITSTKTGKVIFKGTQAEFEKFKEKVKEARRVARQMRKTDGKMNHSIDKAKKEYKKDATRAEVREKVHRPRPKL